MGTDAVVVVVLGRALAVVIGFPRRALVMGDVALVLRMEICRDHARILYKDARLQPDEQAAQDDPFDQNVAHRGSTLVGSMPLSTHNSAK